MKSELLIKIQKEGPCWDYDLVDSLLKEEGKTGDYWKFQFRFWLMEFLGVGLIKDVEYAPDDGSHFSEGNVLMKYEITDLGLQRIHEMLE